MPTYIVESYGANRGDALADARERALHAAELRLLSGHGVPPAQAATWIADANRIRAVIGC